MASQFITAHEIARAASCPIDSAREILRQHRPMANPRAHLRYKPEELPELVALLRSFRQVPEGKPYKALQRVMNRNYFTGADFARETGVPISTAHRFLKSRTLSVPCAASGPQWIRLSATEFEEAKADFLKLKKSNELQPLRGLHSLPKPKPPEPPPPTETASIATQREYNPLPPLVRRGVIAPALDLHCTNKQELRP